MLVMGALSLAYVLLCVLTHTDGWYHQVISPPAGRFGDLTIYQQKFDLFRSEAFHSYGFPFTYPAPVALGYELIFRVGRAHADRVFVILCLLAYLLPGLLFARALRREGITAAASLVVVAILLVTSWPALLIVDRGNMEILVWIALVTAVWAFCTGRGYLAACFFGVAASLKLFPFIFVGLFISRKEWGKLLVAVVVFAVLSLASLAIMGPTVSTAYREIAHGIDFFRIDYMSRWRGFENGVDHSLFALIKLVLVGIFHHPLFGFSRWLALYLRFHRGCGDAALLLDDSEAAHPQPDPCLFCDLHYLHRLLRRWNADSSVLPASSADAARHPGEKS